LPDRYAELFETLLFYDYDENDTQLVAQFSVHAEKLAQEPAERVTDSCINLDNGTSIVNCLGTFVDASFLSQIGFTSSSNGFVSLL
jgi:hypothetical protein